MLDYVFALLAISLGWFVYYFTNLHISAAFKAFVLLFFVLVDKPHVKPANW